MIMLPILLLIGLTAIGAFASPAEDAYQALAAGDREDAVALFRAAIDAENDPAIERRLLLELGHALTALHRPGEAATAFAQAISIISDAQSLAALGYARLAAGEDARALEAFVQAVESGYPDSRLLLEIAYIARRKASGEEAIPWFRRYLDEVADAEDRLLVRREIRNIENRLDGAASLFYRTRGDGRDDLQVGNRSLGASQGILESRFRLLGPPERFIAPFVRALWAIDGASPAPAGDSLQTGFGVSAKPFARQSVLLSAERLVAIGKQARNDWLLRLSASMGDGFEAPLSAERSWTIWSVYAEAALIGLERPDSQFIAEARLGEARLLGGGWRGALFLQTSSLIQDDAGGTLSLFEAGPGFTLALPFGGREHAAAGRSIELTVQYRKTLAGDSSTKSGISLSLAMRF